LLARVSKAVAKAAMDTGVATRFVDIEAYGQSLQTRAESLSLQKSDLQMGVKEFANFTPKEAFL